MILKVLVDNNTLIDRYFIGEPGVSYYIEVDGFKLLFDLGYSDAFIQNGRKMGVDFKQLDAVVVSHSHLDHTWGLEPLLKLMTEAQLESTSIKRPRFFAHPDVFEARTFTGQEEFGMTVGRAKVERYMDLWLTARPYWVTPKLVFLGEIPRGNSFEVQHPIGQIEKEGHWAPDFNLDDSALVYKGEEGLVVITGCSHSGICNILEYAKKVCQEERILDIIGGLHLLEPSEIQLGGTLRYLKQQRFVGEGIHACHCTDLRSKIALNDVATVLEVGVGMTLRYE